MLHRICLHFYNSHLIYQSQRLVATVKQQPSELAFIVRVTALLLLRCEIWYCAPFQSVHSRDFCHGSYKWPYGSNSLLDIRSCANRTNHICGLDDECFFVNKNQVKCSICMRKHVVFNAKPRGILTFCSGRKCMLKYVAGLRCLYAWVYFWISFWLMLYISASICPCTNCKFQRKISDTHQLTMQAKFRMSANFGNFDSKVLPGWDSKKFI